MTRVWAPDKSESFVLADVVSDDGKNVVVNVDGLEKNVKKKDALEVNPSSQDGVADNTELMFLNDAALLHNLKCRYAEDKIYTYTGHMYTHTRVHRVPTYTQTRMHVRMHA